MGIDVGQGGGVVRAVLSAVKLSSPAGNARPGVGNSESIGLVFQWQRQLSRYDYMNTPTYGKVTGNGSSICLTDNRNIPTIKPGLL